MKNILIIGASGHSKMIIDIIIKNNEYNIVGLIDSFKSIDSKIFGYKVIGNENDIPKLIKKHNIFGALISIGDNWVRKQMKELIESKSPNLEFISAIHPSAVLANGVFIPKGTVVMANVTINSDAKVGEFCIINTKSSLGHDSNMDNFSSLAPGVTTGGNITIGFCSAISLGTSVIQNIKIGKHTIVGAASLVIRDIGDYKLAYGIPAREIKNRKPNEKYLS
ncbi:acetyltransferase [Sabulilitoribacter arenilitoris]|uniref:Acetyltransferase n=1 Tax=Wocania arenilitoris TaxID=2044858 RepID=A0AAE3ENE5_9FLAO|nr:acetyltransferase [Wocania arenilitoris]MCF7568625.1 acetyltransferase [Wocania arenilitoris]